MLVNTNAPISADHGPSGKDGAGRSAASVIPRYLEAHYWWAYVHPRAVAVFEREWLVNAILFGHYARLRERALAALGPTLQGRTLQVACVYGNLSPRLLQRVGAGGSLDVVDVLPIQLANLRAKMPADARIRYTLADSSAMPMADASVDQALLFFLLHEQPEPVRRATLSEVMRVVKPGGRIVIVDYHRPHRWHPLRLPMQRMFARLEPYAMDLWHKEIADFLPASRQPSACHKSTYFGGLYQQLVWTR